MAGRLAQNFPGVSVYLGAKNAMTTILIRFRFIIVEQKLFNQKSRQTLLEWTFPARNSKELKFPIHFNESCFKTPAARPSWRQT